jgi:hypothetical protein
VEEGRGLGVIFDTGGATACAKKVGCDTLEKDKTRRYVFWYMYLDVLHISAG